MKRDQNDIAQVICVADDMNASSSHRVKSNQNDITEVLREASALQVKMTSDQKDIAQSLSERLE